MDKGLNMLGVILGIIGVCLAGIVLWAVVTFWEQVVCRIPEAIFALFSGFAWPVWLHVWILKLKLSASKDCKIIGKLIIWIGLICPVVWVLFSITELLKFNSPQMMGTIFGAIYCYLCVGLIGNIMFRKNFGEGFLP